MSAPEGGVMGPADWLKDRATSYSRDAFVLRADGDIPMAVAYQTIADELRKCAEAVENALLLREIAHLREAPEVPSKQPDGIIRKGGKVPANPPPPPRAQSEPPDPPHNSGVSR